MLLDLSPYEQCRNTERCTQLLYKLITVLLQRRWKLIINKLAVITWHVIFVGNADGAESIVRHWLNKGGYHFVLVRLRKLPQLTVVADKPRTPEQVQINIKCPVAAHIKRCLDQELISYRDATHLVRLVAVVLIVGTTT